MVAAVKIPVTVKIRLVGMKIPSMLPLITQIAEQAGAQAICIHGRTRQQAYKGPANWDWIKACKEVAQSIQVIGNGDVFDALAAEKCLLIQGATPSLFPRGFLGQPWIVEDILKHLSGEVLLNRTVEDCRQALLEHFYHTVSYHHARRVVVDMRRVGCWYLKKSAGTRAFREQISRAESLEQVRDLILNFPLGEIAIEESGEQEECDTAC